MRRNAILVVDDNDDVREVIRETLMDSYSVYEVATGKRIVEALSATPVDLVLLDIGLPDGNGLSFIPAIRAHGNIPIIILSGLDAIADKTRGLESGADDYIAKPFHPDELRARIRAGLRRYNQSRKTGPKKEPAKIIFFHWLLDRSRLQVIDLRSNSPCDLTFYEFQLVEALVMAAGRVLRRDELLAMTGEDAPGVNARVIDVRVARIRKKLRDNAGDSPIIKTVRGAGYVLDCETKEVE